MEIKFFIGPMSKNIVDSIIEFQTESKNKIGLIPVEDRLTSRRLRK